MTRYLFSNQQEQELVKIVETLKSSFWIREVTDYSEPSTFQDENQMSPELEMEIGIDFGMARSNEINYLLRSPSSLLPLAHSLLVLGETGYTFNLVSKDTSDFTSDEISNTPGYHSLIGEYGAKKDTPMDDLPDKLLAAISRSGGLRSPRKFDENNARMSVFAEASGKIGEIYIMGNNLGVTPREDAITAFFVGNTDGIYRIGEIESFGPHNPTYLDSNDLGQFINFLKTGKDDLSSKRRNLYQ
tara:strand:- start:1476 stop:2207 length:732 start_codon:yes stop_codon:yes gene_type:complete